MPSSAPEQRQPQIEAGRDHVEQHAFDVVLAGFAEHLQEDIHIRVHGQDEVLIHPQRQVPEHAPELDGKDSHGADDHHGDGIARQHHDHGQ